MKLPILLTAMSLVFAGAAAAQAPAPPAEEFVATAAVSNTFEIDSGRIAAENAENPEVKEFADKIVSDHTDADEKLRAAAEEAGVATPVPETLDPRHEEMIQQLNAATGAEFDTLYAEIQVQAHEEAVDLFSSYAEQGDEEPLREFASSTLPHLEEHLEQARELQQQVSQ